MTELVEADSEIGFSLMDLADDNPTQAHRLIADAENVYADILERLGHFTSSEGEIFQPLVTELRRAIDIATSLAA